MITYSQLNANIRDKINALPIHWAFSKSQFNEELQEMGLTENDKDKLCTAPGGGFCLKTDLKHILDTLAETTLELDEALKDDDFCVDAIVYELENHEYCYTGDATDTLECLGLDENDARVKRLLDKAKKLCWNRSKERNKINF